MAALNSSSRRRARSLSTPGPVRINLGSGLQHVPGWINYDRSRSALIANSPLLRRMLQVAFRLRLTRRREPLAWPKETRVHDLTRGIPHADDSVDIVYSSHFLEHLTRDAADRLLEEAFRVLRPGGWFRLVVPDLRVLAEAYARRDRDYFRNAEGTLADAFMTSLHLGERIHRKPLEKLARRLLRTDEGGHRWMYDADSLIHRMREAGFIEVASTDFREGRCTEAARLDNQPRTTVYIEGIKP